MNNDAYQTGEGCRPARIQSRSVWHTHLVKRVLLDQEGAVYLNSGTWADLMQLPDGVLNGDEAEGKQQLEKFVDDLVANQLENWRRLIPTFARIELNGDAVTSSDVYFFDGKNQVERVPDGRLTRLTD